MVSIMSVNAEPPLRSAAQADLLIGKDSHGHWVVKDRHGLRGGIFVNHAQALKYALSEVGHRMQAIAMATGCLEMDMSGVASVMVRAQTSPARHVA